ncbi:PP2C family protein-serine/threonine phosphatase [uncultured Jatrophihabitans sp.]|uniref:PP2C family protein-serine/threonine phosphatase n=1 Tax=uncultured Jatrophihabitans sp. TaxID=1610747 RepID=UPI0035CBE513
MTSPFTLLELAHSATGDTAALRAVALRAARLVGCDDVDSTRVATSVSELARLAPDGVAVQVRVAVTSPRQRAAGTTLTISFAFPGAGSALTLAVQAAVSRLMDSVHIAADEVAVSRDLPRALSPGQLVDARETLAREKPQEPESLLQGINDELVATLVELREREADLVQLNGELGETNRGVVALYAELEARSAEVRAAQRKVFEELSDALRPPSPSVQGLELAVTYLPAQENSPTGGDLYDWFVLPDGQVHVSVIDVRGHGVVGTRDALHVTHTVRTLVLDARPIGDLLAQTHALVSGAAQPVVATALVAQLDPVTGLLRLAGAGHPPALRVSAAGVTTYLEAPGRPVGYEGGGSRTVSVTALDPGDTVLLYTDGLIEVRHDVIEGMDRLARVATELRHLPLPELVPAIVHTCADGVELSDDTLLLGLRWPGLRTDT